MASESGVCHINEITVVLCYGQSSEYTCRRGQWETDTEENNEVHSGEFLLTE